MPEAWRGHPALHLAAHTRALLNHGFSKRGNHVSPLDRCRYHYYCYYCYDYHDYDCYYYDDKYHYGNDREPQLTIVNWRTRGHSCMAIAQSPRGNGGAYPHLLHRRMGQSHTEHLIVRIF